MNKFESYIINKTNEMLNEGFIIDDIINNVEEMFNVVYQEEINNLFKNYSLDIMEIYFNNELNNYGTRNINDIVIIVISNILYNNYINN